MQRPEGSPKPGLEALAAQGAGGPALLVWAGGLITTTLNFAKAPGRGTGAALRSVCGDGGAGQGD